MMKRLLSLFLLLACTGLVVQAQVTGVSTAPENKIAIIEEFSGVRCVNCPDGHIVLNNILSTYPGQVFTVSFHPNNSSYTPPYSGDPDLQRAYPAAFYSTPYCGSSRFMPSAFINRREWTTGEKITSRNIWESSAQTIMGEASPMNVGVIADYNENTMMLDITVEVYYTSNVADQNALYVTLSESGIFTQQSGGSNPYEQTHVFREAFTAQWGDNIQNTTSGSLNTYTFSFDNSTMNYDMTQAEVIAYVENKSNEEVYTGWGTDVSLATGIAEGPQADALEIRVYPNPFQSQTAVVYALDHSTDVSYRILNVVGQEVAAENLGTQDAGSHRIDIDAAEAGLTSGVYLVQVTAGETVATERMVVR